jgi:hypothetical protein
MYGRFTLHVKGLSGLYLQIMFLDFKLSLCSEYCVLVSFLLTPPMTMEQTECSETSAYKIQTPENYPEENIQNFPGLTEL